MVDGSTAELIIPARCLAESRIYRGFVTRLGRSHAYFATRGRAPCAGEALLLEMELPWRLGSLAIAARRSNATPAEPPRVPGVALRLGELSDRDRSRVERYLTRFHELVAELG